MNAMNKGERSAAELIGGGRAVPVHTRGRRGMVILALTVAALTACAHGRELSAPEGSAARARSAADPEPLTLGLWPGAAPGSPAGPGRGRAVERPADPVRGAIARITDVTEPVLTLYRPRNAGAAAPAIVVFPGGGYQHLSVDIEGTEVCRWLTEAGIACVLATYRVPQPPGSTRYVQPLQDAQRAVGLVRFHAREWGVDPRQVGVLGFSAGAHLAAMLSTRTTGRAYDPVDAADGESSRPDFALLLYPAYMVANRGDTRIAEEVRPAAGTPPMFLVQTADDPIGAENSLAYALALREAGVPVELHLYAKGGHGYGLRSVVGEVATTWPRLALRWLGTLGVTSPSASPEVQE